MKTTEACEKCGCSPCDCGQEDAYSLTNKTVKLLGPARQHAKEANRFVRQSRPSLESAATLLLAAKTPSPYPRDITTADLFAKMFSGSKR
jgi:hypothetical protein